MNKLLIDFNRKEFFYRRLLIDIVSDVIGLMGFLSSQLIFVSSIRIDYRVKIELMCHPTDK